jgi:hypothetical protein
MTVGITELPPEGMQLGGVALAGDPDRGTKTTEGLSLLFTTAGITVQGPQPQIERLLVWSGLDTAACREKIVLPDGRAAAVMELTSGGQSIRFLLPTETVTAGQAAYLDQALPAWLARYRGVPAPTAPAPAATAPSPPSPPAPPSSSGWGAPAEGPGRAAAAAGAVIATGATVGAGPRATDWATRRSAGPEAAFPGSQATETPPSTLSPPPPPPPRPDPPSAPVGPPRPPAVVAPASAPPPPLPPLPPAAPVTAASVPPPPPVTAPSPPLPTTVAPPPPPLGPGTPVWQTAIDPMPEGTAWDNPPLGQAEVAGSQSGTKKARGKRRNRSPDAAFATPPGAPAPPPQPPQAPQAPLPPQAPPVPPTLPPMQQPPPPLQQQPLQQPPPPPPPLQAQYPPPPPAAKPIDPGSPVTPAPPLPPPPEGAGAFNTQGVAVWRPAIDPLTGEARWDEAYAPTDPYAPVPSPPATTWRGRRRAKAAAVAAAAATATATAGTLGAPGAAAPDQGTTLDPLPPPPPPQPEADAPWGASDPLAALPTDWTGGGHPPAATGDEAGPPEPDKPASRNNRTVLILSVILVLVIGGIVYILVKPKNTTTTPPTLTPTSGPSQVAADAALAASINLRLTDLPTGWSTSTAAGQVARPPIAPAAAQVRADRLLASCVGADYATVAGLFGGSVIPGQTDSARSPRFQSPTDANIQMYSATAVMGTAARAQALTLPFANPNFVNCFGEYQTALASAAVPGATATVQVVTLAAPSGVKSFGYLTNLTIPNQTNQVVGEAFMVGGRIETRLEPTTAGPAVPSDAFTSAYNAIAGRIAAARNN